MFKFVSFLIAFAVLAGLIIGLPALYAYKTVENVACHVEEKERIADDGDSKYLIFCTEEVFQNSDSLFHMKFGSSDFYKDIKEGEDYEFKVYGWRVPFFSMYRNIIKIT